MAWKKTHWRDEVMFSYIPDADEQREATIIGKAKSWRWSAAINNCLPMGGEALADGEAVSADSAKEDVLAWFTEMDSFLEKRAQVEARRDGTPAGSEGSLSV